VSNAVQQMGNRVPQNLDFAKNGQILVNRGSVAASHQKTVIWASYRHLSPRKTCFLTTLFEHAIVVHRTCQTLGRVCLLKPLKNSHLLEWRLEGTRTRSNGLSKCAKVFPPRNLLEIIEILDGRGIWDRRRCWALSRRRQSSLRTSVRLRFWLRSGFRLRLTRQIEVVPFSRMREALRANGPQDGRSRGPLAKSRPKTITRWKAT
jgi:hypothetical protein